MDKLGTEMGFCAQTAAVWQFVGQCLLVIKVILPVVLIIMGVITLGKAVISDDEKDVKKGFTKMLHKFIVAVIIFFIPSIVTALFNVVGGFDDVSEDYAVCKSCISSPRGESCKTIVKSNTK